MKVFISASLIGVMLACGSAPGQTAGTGYDLESVKYIEKASFSEPARDLLGRHGFVVAGPQFKQVFQVFVIIAGQRIVDVGDDEIVEFCQSPADRIRRHRDFHFGGIKRVERFPDRLLVSGGVAVPGIMPTDAHDAGF